MDRGSSLFRTPAMGYDGSTWVTIGTAAVSVGSGNYPSLVFSPSGTPYVSFEDGGSGSKVTVMKLSPAGTSVDVPSGGSYSAGQTLSFTVNFSNAVTVSGTPRIALNIGGTTRYANYVSGSVTTALF